jgi:hypothetical protein
LYFCCDAGPLHGTEDCTTQIAFRVSFHVEVEVAERHAEEETVALMWDCGLLLHCPAAKEDQAAELD